MRARAAAQRVEAMGATTRSPAADADGVQQQQPSQQETKPRVSLVQQQRMELQRMKQAFEQKKQQPVKEPKQQNQR